MVELKDVCHGRNRGCNLTEIQSQGFQGEDKESNLEVALRKEDNKPISRLCDM